MTSDIKTLKKKGSFKWQIGVLTIRVVSKSVDVEAVVSGGQSFNLPRHPHRSRLVLGDDQTSRIKQAHFWLTQQSDGKIMVRNKKVRVPIRECRWGLTHFLENELLKSLRFKITLKRVLRR